MRDLKQIDPTVTRSKGKTEIIGEYISEYATMKTRVELEIEWLIFVNGLIGKKELLKDEIQQLREVYKKFSEEDASWIDEKDKEINHDTKSAEYFVRMKLEVLNLEDLAPLVHIGLTSADIDNNVFVLCTKRFEKEHLAKVRNNQLEILNKLIKDNRESVFLGKTHGKFAVPTTMGKELANYYHRLKKLDKKLSEFNFEGKLTGAVGNWNALIDSYEDIDWVKPNKKFIKHLGLEPNMFTTQILPYDNLIEYLHLTHQYNYVLIDLSKNMWTYISEGYFKLKVNRKEVGSSTMAHKVNPIDFERCESNLIMSSSIIETLARNLPTNRLQRDLTDKHLVRELGPLMARAVLGCASITEGLKKVSFNKEKAQEELSQHWEILSEPMQTILRTYGYQDAYEVIKDNTRGKTLTEKEYMKLVEELDISNEAKEELKELKPERYIGWAKDILKEL
ncbi:MAG: adenylosuccinate lyase [candidate division WS6 bacterium 34_10]|uniref:Adenylosuccinate lyase n=1 Tax=candidate division WS6 bacterium 34_10 TaxID=1641389 RepID=A0A101HI11_9BACT|nr:MAG: adenylosuccinate lyase [candidate division WS6 bacterium 34_10]